MGKYEKLGARSRGHAAHEDRVNETIHLLGRGRGGSYDYRFAALSLSDANELGSVNERTQ